MPAREVPGLRGQAATEEATMTDYGHDLIFGTFITPQNQRPQEAVRLAQLTERAGLDLVTFQDHPYHPGFLETWTLLSYVAAATERVRLSGYVLNLPSRPPAVLARAAASLDLLSSGRVELGIGPGDTFALGAVEAIGGPRRTAAQAVTALDEAIDIIRGIWDAAAPGRVTVDGEQYHVRGAARGPAPAHDISIWVPAGGPRMRRLVGRKADGWISGGLWLTDVPGELARGNRVIDEAAAKAGRDPRQIRRIFDFAGTFSTADRGFAYGSPRQWAEQLLPLAIEHGVSVFILPGDDPDAIERFGHEVAPALREAVASERGSVKM
jgi:alkanesulfonate monooxygenase SsuD/methylene tetrahydromethanopterin reductase-like flavin-dependent oxidoreductase (luciferase family)